MILKVVYLILFLCILLNCIITTDILSEEKLLVLVAHLEQLGLIFQTILELSVTCFNPLNPFAQAALLDSHNTPNTTLITKSYNKTKLFYYNYKQQN